MIDIVNLGTSFGKGSEAPLEIPFVGGFTQMLVANEVADADEWLYNNAFHDFISMGTFLVSIAGKRSGLTAVYASEEVMLDILKNGGLVLSRDKVAKGCCYTYGAPTSTAGEPVLKYMIIYKYDKWQDVHKEFGVLPITR